VTIPYVSIMLRFTKRLLSTKLGWHNIPKPIALKYEYPLPSVHN